MDSQAFTVLLQTIVAEAARLRDARTNEREAPVNYACIFSQSEEEYAILLTVANELGKVVQETEMGPVFYMEPITTIAGDLRIVKVRKPDPKRPERGDADFTVSNYPSFKANYLKEAGFKLIERPDMEMIELADPAFDVLAYFSNPPLGAVLQLEF